MGALSGRWAPHDLRDEVVHFVGQKPTTSELPIRRFLGWLTLSSAKFYRWKLRFGLANENNGKVPRDFWLEDWERQAVVAFHEKHPLEGYRRLTFMKLNQDIVAISPTSVYRILSSAGRLDRWNRAASRKGKGFAQPDAAHRHWHADIAYVNVGGTFYYLISVLDGYSRYMVHWELRESMTEVDVEIVLERARERVPEARPRRRRRRRERPPSLAAAFSGNLAAE